MPAADFANKQPYVSLSNGQKIPQIGLGTWKAGPNEVGNAVKAAIEAGYRHIDCAAVYTNEHEVGQAIKECIDRGIVKREELFIVTKLWNTCHARDKVFEACDISLQQLGLDYLDMYLMHYPVPMAYTGPTKPDLKEWIPWDDQKQLVKLEKSPLHETWAAMEELVHKGKTKAIGISNFTIPVLIDLWTYAKILPATNQVECHPYFQRRELRELCKKFGIPVTAYSPLGSGKQGPLQDPTIKAIATKYKKTPAQVLLRWNIQHGNIVIPKSSKEERVKENMNILDFGLSPEDMQKIDGLDRGFMTCDTREYWRGFAFFAV
ncbi:uncharacterized protein SPPG_08121 [Spizellomyces punctatus DAOM BR117]|uniref:NADP-dependent oxidoreductase domain-containing protein n=1 Tax=Spizellomyces punctatus (strain DAOM BR117) TaxID=645134 RepID=A0A0L0H735_SPIPD|nr:uncharacterized protein SPPG_08121 [Spizellomyces punctatus DAOM BR117]KNC96533.1 hypothetical protein SPPG_08121 [Spizellomyces punctatus DAOM BR117]|eukprot:XP_016604573.1 hypothetical protein SPPG_08121 [Spizellomyces punctatus DAOM BR117]